MYLERSRNSIENWFWHGTKTLLGWGVVLMIIGGSVASDEGMSAISQGSEALVQAGAPAEVVDFGANALLDWGNLWNKGQLPQGLQTEQKTAAKPSKTESKQTAPVVSSSGSGVTATDLGIFKEWYPASAVAANEVSAFMKKTYPNVKISAAAIQANNDAVKKTETGVCEVNQSSNGPLCGSGPQLTNGCNSSKACGSCQFLRGSFQIYSDQMVATKNWTTTQVGNLFDYRQCVRAMAYKFAMRKAAENTPCLAATTTETQYKSCFARRGLRFDGLSDMVWNALDSHASSVWDLGQLRKTAELFHMEQTYDLFLNFWFLRGSFTAV